MEIKLVNCEKRTSPKKVFESEHLVLTTGLDPQVLIQVQPEEKHCPPSCYVKYVLVTFYVNSGVMSKEYALSLLHSLEKYSSTWNAILDIDLFQSNHGFLCFIKTTGKNHCCALEPNEDFEGINWCRGEASMLSLPFCTSPFREGVTSSIEQVILTSPLNHENSMAVSSQDKAVQTQENPDKLYLVPF